MKQLILDIQTTEQDKVSAAAVGITLVEKLMLQSIEFDVPYAKRADWFDNLSASDGITLAGEFARCFDLENLMKQVNTLFGKK